MFHLSGPEMLLIALVVFLLFGVKKLPEMARGLGEGIREFRKAVSGALDDKDTSK